MQPVPVQRWLILVVLSLALLAGCTEQAEQDPRYAADQKYFFLESLKQIESGGGQLRSARDDTSVRAALEVIDQGLKLAFQVEPAFLEKIDGELGRFYQRFLIEGVEAYRIGIEAGDAEQQRKGLELLTRWAEYWAGARQTVEARLTPG